MSLAAESIGPFRIEREIGRGGMGVVYLARDTRLDRQVAIKALPEHLSEDPDRLARFQREAKVLASLNHSGIGAIYGMEEVEGRRYLVLEYVEGESLAARLEKGALPVDEALEIAKQIAEALEAAHEKGIIHRDLKPGNVMISDEGRAKVLDFGLARSAEGSPSSTSVPLNPESPTMTSPARIHSPTIPGVILGSAGYMSPEQARGRAVDKRSDIFSFGCVLYEMLTGAQPFPGETTTDSIGAILHREPDWASLPAQTPARIHELLGGCLAKDRRQRLHDIGDARIQLERAITGHEWTATASARPARRWAMAGGALAAVLLLVGGTWVAATRWGQTERSQSQPIRLSIPSRTAAYAQASSSRLSPDGRSIVFLARAPGADDWSLWVRPLDSFEARPLPETGGADQPFWSWDSRFIAFHADGKLWSVDVVQGGSRRLIAAVPANVGATWGPSGEIILSEGVAENRLCRIPAGGGTPEPLTTLDPALFERIHAWPRFLPDGVRYFFVGVGFNPDEEVRIGRLYMGRLGSTERTFIANIISPVRYIEPDRLIYVDDGAIKAAPFDLDSMRITGDAATVADGAFFFKAFGATSVSVSNNGTIAFEPPGEEEELAWFDERGLRVGAIGPKGDFDAPRIAPDGTRVAVGVSDRRTGASDMWIFGIGRATSSRLTTDARWEGGPLWSRDGATLYFSWDRSDAPWIYSINADGSGPIRDVYGKGSAGQVWFAEDIAPDGATLLVSGNVDRLGSELRLVPLSGQSDAVAFRSTPSDEFDARFSPDGKWIAYSTDESGRPEVYLAPYPGPGPKIQVSEGGGTDAGWSRAGDRLFYLREASGDQPGASGVSAIMAVDLDRPDSFQSPPRPRVLFESAQRIENFDIAPDGKRFLLHLSPLDTPAIRVILNGVPWVGP